ncbi:MAG: hypothetical protein WCD21_27955, partial [Streptomyces sp.]
MSSAGAAAGSSVESAAESAVEQQRLGGLVRSCAAVFLPAEVPREGRVAFWAPEGELPGAAGGGAIEGAVEGEIPVVCPHGKGVRTRTVPALILPVAEAIPLLLHAA